MRQHYRPERPQAGAFMAAVALLMWWGLLPAVVYLTSH